MDDSDKKIATMVIVIFIAIAAYGGYRVVKGYIAENDVEDLIVERGDTVIMNYSGTLDDPRLYNEPAVFDTSMASVANYNDTHPKTHTYSWRADPAPFTFVAGQGSVIKGWDSRVLGMKEGETETWVITAEQAYEPRLDDLVITYDKVDSNPIYETLSSSEFSAQYPGAAMTIDAPLVHAYWGWPATVYSTTTSEVVILSTPTVGDTYETVYGWTTEVTAMNQSADSGNGVITIEHQPVVGDTAPVSSSSFDEDMAAINDLRSANQRPGDGIVVEDGTSTFTVDYNSETYGVTLTFTVTVLEIQKAPENL